MTRLINGLHHVTALAGGAQKNLNFYAGILGLRLLKKTINFDAPDVYHLYYGDETGSPGSIMTFFRTAPFRVDAKAPVSLPTQPSRFRRNRLASGWTG